MNPEEYYIGEDERVYVSPTVSRDEQFEFIDTLRDQIGKNNTLISTQTEQLGTDIQPSLGGLTGSEGYFQQRYQTTPVETQVNTLKATAQAKALNDLMTNYAEQAKNRYQQAYRAAQKRANSPDTPATDDDPFEKLPIEDTQNNTGLGEVVVDFDDFNGEGGVFTTDINSGYGYFRNQKGDVINTNDPNYAQANYRPMKDNYYYDISQISTPIWAEALSPVITGANTGVSYEQWLKQWKANQAAKKKYAESRENGTSRAGGSLGGGGAW